MKMAKPYKSVCKCTAATKVATVKPNKKEPTSVKTIAAKATTNTPVVTHNVPPPHSRTYQISTIYSSRDLWS
jgi:hypothetical protein